MDGRRETERGATNGTSRAAAATDGRPPKRPPLTKSLAVSKSSHERTTTSTSGNCSSCPALEAATGPAASLVPLALSWSKKRKQHHQFPSRQHREAQQKRPDEKKMKKKKRTWNGDGLGQRTCWADNCLDLGKHSCNRSWMAAREAASSLLHGRAPVVTKRCNWRNNKTGH